MIVRSWEGVARPGKADAYLTHLTDHILPEIRSVPGNAGAQVLQGVGGDSDRFMVLTFWTDLGVIEAFAGTDIGHAVVPPEAQAVLADFDERARHFDVVVDQRGAT